jgi:hypothetical protein
MTMPPVAPQMPVLDPANPHQMMAYFGAWLYATDPKAIEDSWRNIGMQAANWVTTYIETGLASMGMKRGNPQERMEAYVRKYRWPTEIDPATGQLLHPIMTQQEVVDPATGMPTGQFQDVPTDRGEDLWDEQMQMFPRQFLIDAHDAYDMGAPLPQWVELLVSDVKQREATPEGKKALKSATQTQVYKPKQALKVAA